MKRLSEPTIDVEATNVTYRGIVKDGVIHLEPDVTLADGTKVEVAPCETGEPQPGIFEKLGALAGQADGLPPDLARNHDRYLHDPPGQ